MSTDFGVDLKCDDDLDPAMGEVSGLDLMRQAARHRLTTRRGSLLRYPDNGIDVRELLSEGVDETTLAQIPSTVDGELAKEQRFLSSTTVATWDEAAAKLTLTITIETAEGPFDLVLSVTKVTVELLGGAP